MVKKQSGDELPLGFWVREDGALCWGNECLVVKPEGKDLRFTINEEKCGSVALDKYRDLIEETIGHGGKTIYEVPAKVDRD
jgi:hypothetical protein